MVRNFARAGALAALALGATSFPWFAMRRGSGSAFGLTPIAENVWTGWTTAVFVGGIALPNWLPALIVCAGAAYWAARSTDLRLGERAQLRAGGMLVLGHGVYAAVMSMTSTGPALIAGPVLIAVAGMGLVAFSTEKAGIEKDERAGGEPAYHSKGADAPSP